MRVPGFMFQQQVTVTPYEGSGAYGPQYGSPFPERCRIEPRNQLVRDRDGNETVASAKLYAFPESRITVQSIVTWNGREYDVIEVVPEAGPGGAIHHREVTLR